MDKYKFQFVSTIDELSGLPMSYLHAGNEDFFVAIQSFRTYDSENPNLLIKAGINFSFKEDSISFNMEKFFYCKIQEFEEFENKFAEFILSKIKTDLEIFDLFEYFKNEE